MPAKKWNRETVVRRVSQLHREGSQLHSRYIRKQYPSLHNAANRYCRGWRQAIELAGIEYESIHKKGYNPNRVWNKEKVISAIHARYQLGLLLNYHAMATESEALLGAGTRCFGSWRKALECAGFNYTLIKKKTDKKWDKAKIVLEIIGRSAAGLSIKGGDVKLQDKGLYVAARRHFGKKGWAQARVCAGFDPIDPYPWQKWSAENVTSEIKRLHSLGVSLNTGAIVGVVELERLRSAGRKVFGNWANAIRAAGLDYSKISKVRRNWWTKERVISILWNLHRHGIDISSRAIRNVHRDLYSMGNLLFGNWGKAVEAAGIDYQTIMRTRPHGWWTEAKVKQALQSLEESGVRLSAKAMQTSYTPLYSAAVARFGSWRQAVEAAGISYRRHSRVWSIKAWLQRMNQIEYEAIMQSAKAAAVIRRKKKRR